MEIYASRSDCGNLFILFRIFANDISRSFFLRGSGAKNSVSLTGFALTLFNIFCKLYCLPPLRRHLSHAIRIVWKRQDWTGNSLPIHVRIAFYTRIFCLPFRDLNSIVVRILSSPIPYIRFLRQRKLSNTVCRHRRCFRTWTVSLSGLLPVLPLSGAGNYLLW